MTTTHLADTNRAGGIPATLLLVGVLFILITVGAQDAATRQLVMKGCRDAARLVRPPPRTCLVLSIGGPKGVAHVGAIDALKEKGVELHCVFGNSMGSIVGGLYASGPADNQRGRYQRLWTAYGQTTAAEKKSAGATGAAAGLGLMLLSGGTLGWQGLLGGTVVGGAVGANGVETLCNERLRRVYDEYTNGATIDSLPLPFATAYQVRADDGLEMKVATKGSLAKAVARSANNPFIFNPDVRRQRHLDPGGDRAAAVPIEEAFRTFRPDRIIAINVTGQPPLYTSKVTCPVIEVKVNVGVVGAGAVTGAGPDFERVYEAGYRAVAADTRF